MSKLAIIVKLFIFIQTFRTTTNAQCIDELPGSGSLPTSEKMTETMAVHQNLNFLKLLDKKMILICIACLVQTVVLFGCVIAKWICSRQYNVGNTRSNERFDTPLVNRQTEISNQRGSVRRGRSVPSNDEIYL